ncbi:hypothetical protein Afil01_67620 [Actinorhabdospora filicis]|uniref:Uncharacterized protein n=1 Tax=Actinorhabdospora filicis TaxID=1785913 RepID=A0A9W6SS82_9ACTN|nr:hypothetical protein [Actinorhabdospora filicis]GLZ81955.1 hypothetical protein Afil01_67620 [Actinorhabdospora filicis]
MVNEETTVVDTYEYVLWEVCKSPEGAVHFVIRQAAAAPDISLKEMRAGLVPWGLAALTSTFHEMGLYWVALHPADPEGNYDTKSISDTYITWGTGALHL